MEGAGPRDGQVRGIPGARYPSRGGREELLVTSKQGPEAVTPIHSRQKKKENGEWKE